MKKPICTLQGKNTIEIFKDHAEIIIIAKNKEESRVLIDNEDINKVKDYLWCRHGRLENNAKAVFSSELNTNLCRLLLDFPDQYVNYKNGNKLDCRKSNLQLDQNHSVNGRNFKENEYEIFEDHAEIIIATEEEEWRVLIDLEDVDKCKEHNWRVNTSGIHGGGNVYLHRLLTDFPKGKEVVHENGDKHDCRKENLMVFTHKEKTEFYKDKKAFLAKKEQQNNKSYGSAPVLEVEPEKVERNYSNITKISNGYLITLELKDESYTEFFSTKEEAIEAYDNKVREIYKDAALDSYHSLVDHFMESDPYGLYK